MLLALPPQTAPDTGSFPQERDAVRTWLDALAPVDEPQDAAELLRGLRHSNRLTNDPIQRRLVLNELRPAIKALSHSLSESITPQPLPMAAPFRHASAMLDELLREEANAWKILLNESAKPELNDAAAALEALYQQAKSSVQQYRRVHSVCIRDANQIYALVEANDLLSKGSGLRDSKSSPVKQFLDAYAGILILATIDLRQIRARQLNLTLSFLANYHETVRLTQSVTDSSWRRLQCVVNLEDPYAPVPAASYLGDFESDALRWVNFTELSQAVDTRLSRTRTTASMTLGSDTLERQTLTRLSQTFSANRTRRSARCINYETVNLAFGHQQIANQLLRNLDNENSSNTGDEPATNTEWLRLNYSQQGSAFQSLNPDIGSTQVGELVVIFDEADKPTLGLIRWVLAMDDDRINIGVEYLSSGTVPVELTRSDADEGVTDEALIIACRISGKITQTILLPGYRFHTGDRLTASQADKRKQIKLGQCLQSNGLFSHFVLNEA